MRRKRTDAELLRDTRAQILSRVRENLETARLLAGLIGERKTRTAIRRAVDTLARGEFVRFLKSRSERT